MNRDEQNQLCESCGEVIDEDEFYYCHGCGNQICELCAEICHNCKKYFCEDCYSTHKKKCK